MVMLEAKYVSADWPIRNRGQNSMGGNGALANTFRTQKNIMYSKYFPLQESFIEGE